MKFFTVSTAVLFSLHLEFVLLDYVESPQSSSEKDWLNNISVQDVLSSGIGLNATEKIEKKIINTLKQYAFHCPTFGQIDLSMEGFTFPVPTVQVDLGSTHITFDDIRISKLSSTKRKLYSTSIECQSTRMAKIEVKLPEDLKISAHLEVPGSANISSEFETSIDVFHEGSISLILKNYSISKQFPPQTNDEKNIRWKMFYSKSVVSLDIATELQIPIYNKLQTILDKMQSPIQEFLIKKFNVEFTKSGISVANTCSKFINTDKNSEKIDLPSGNQSQHNLYLIPNRDLLWYGKGEFHNAGPILIDGLDSFNNTKFIVSENKASSSEGNGYYFLTTPRHDDSEIREITVKIKTNNLKGKVDYRYNSELFSITFILEFIEFEVKIRNMFQYESKSGSQKYDKSGKQHYYPSGSYARSNGNKVDVQLDVNSGKIHSKLQNVSVFKNDSDIELIVDILTRNLISPIVLSLIKTMEKNFQKECLLANYCP